MSRFDLFFASCTEIKWEMAQPIEAEKMTLKERLGLRMKFVVPCVCAAGYRKWLEEYKQSGAGKSPELNEVVCRDECSGCGF